MNDPINDPVTIKHHNDYHNECVKCGYKEVCDYEFKFVTLHVNIYGSIYYLCTDCRYDEIGLNLEDDED